MPAHGRDTREITESKASRCDGENDDPEWRFRWVDAGLTMYGRDRILLVKRLKTLDDGLHVDFPRSSHATLSFCATRRCR